MEQLSSPKRKSRESGEAYGVICWFSRLKTAELYLHDVSVLADMLPLLLLAPYVGRREDDPAVFEIAAPRQDDALETNGGSGEGEDEDGEQEPDPELGLPPPPLLLRLSDPTLADDLWALREKLSELVDRIIGQPPMKLPAEVAAAFRLLRTLVHTSYRIHGMDYEACDAFKAEDDMEDAAPRGDDSSCYGGKSSRTGGGRKGKGKGKGGGFGGGYPWWQHIKKDW